MIYRWERLNIRLYLFHREFLIFTSIVSFFSGAVLSTLVEKERQAYEFRLQMIEKMKSELE